MGRGLDVTSNQEHDYFTCFCGKGWESSSKTMLASGILGGCSDTTSSQEVLRLIQTILWRDDRPEEKKRTKRWVDLVKA